MRLIVSCLVDLLSDQVHFDIEYTLARIPQDHSFLPQINLRNQFYVFCKVVLVHGHKCQAYEVLTFSPNKILYHQSIQ